MHPHLFPWLLPLIQISLNGSIWSKILMMMIWMMVIIMTPMIMMILIMMILIIMIIMIMMILMVKMMKSVTVIWKFWIYDNDYDIDGNDDNNDTMVMMIYDGQVHCVSHHWEIHISCTSSPLGIIITFTIIILGSSLLYSSYCDDHDLDHWSLNCLKQVRSFSSAIYIIPVVIFSVLWNLPRFLLK